VGSNGRNLEELLLMSLERGVSDVHIVAGRPPLFRVHTVLEPIDDWPVVVPETAEKFVLDMLGPERFDRLRERRDLDFSISVKEACRFRVNAHYQRESLAVAFRLIPSDIPPLATLGLPPAVEALIDLPRGLVLVTGQTGAGKSTTLAAMINEMNQRYKKHVITLEDPIEYTMEDNECVIEQREVGVDVVSFASGLRHALRQDPDVILVGEMRDLETTSAAITAAETGHLVLSTMHTQGAAQTIERIIDIYPAEQQSQIRSMLATTLQAVISQVLFKRIDVPGMVPACEVMMCTSAIRNCIRENRIHEIPNVIETSRSAGMCTMDDAIKALFLNGQISRQRALSQAVRPDAMERLLSA
jgi:twitching motility protein PilT